MAYRRKFPIRNPQEKSVKCSCGGEAKMRSRKNYPHGRKSKAITSRFYRCLSCHKQLFTKNLEGGKK